MKMPNWIALDENWRFAITAFLVARIFYAIWSWVILTIQPIAVHYIDAGSEPGVIFLRLENAQTYTYLRTVAGEALSFRSASPTTVTDLQTGSVWMVTTGVALDGPYKGSTLASIPTPTNMFPYHTATPFPNAWLAVWQRFDVTWYTTLADNGYGSISGDDHYPPLYPLMIRLTTPFFGNSFLAALVISHAATLYALKLLLDLFSQWSNPQTGRKTLFYFLLYPTAFYLFSAYTEPIFLVVALLAFRNMKANDWGWAGFWTFCAISTRLQGAALIPAMLFLMWRDKPFLQKVSHWAGLGFSGVALFFYLFLRSTQVDTGPVPFSEPAWNARLVPPWQTYIYAVQSLLSGDFNYIDLINWFVATLFVVLLILGWREMPMEYNLYTTFSILTIFIRIVDGQPLISMSRYALTLFPLFFILAKVDSHPIGRRIVIYTSIALSLYLSQEFFSWGWVA